MPADIKPGDIAECQFLDHCQDDTDAIELTLWGRISDIKSKTITFQTWGYANAAPGFHDDNTACYTIVRGAIVKLKVLRKA